MGEKRVIEQIASDEIYNDDWFLKDSVLHDTTKVQPSVIKEYVNQGMATSQDLADEATARQNTDSQLASGISKQMSNLADFYDTTKSYVVGDVCVLQSGELMRCIAPTSGTFDNTKWEQVTVDELFDDLNFSANAISYDNETSGLEADNVQDAIDEVLETAGKVDDIVSNGQSLVENKIADLSSLTAVGSASGDIAIFPDGSDLSMPKLEVAIEPVQDLHRYDSPWVGGAGKNKLPLTEAEMKRRNTSGTWNNNAYTLNGLTFTIKTDESNNIIGININGTASNDTTFTVYDETLNLGAEGSYTMSGCPLNGSTSTYRLSVFRPNSGSANDVGNGIAYSYDEPIRHYVFIAIISGTTLNNSLFQPMIESGSTATSYAPYSNICPISGWDECNVGIVGSNLIDITSFTPTYALNGITYTINTDGSVVANGTATGRSQVYWSIPQDIAKTFANKKLSGLKAHEGCSLFLELNETPYTNYGIDTGEGATIDSSIENATTTVNFVIRITSGTTVSNYVVIPRITDELRTYTLSLGSTRYGGKVDLVSGVMTVDRATISGRVTSLSSNTYSNIVYGTIEKPNDSKNKGNTEVHNLISSMYPVSPIITGWDNADNIGKMFVGASYTQFWIGFPLGTTLQDAQTETNNNVLCYELATPLTIQLTPTVVKSLRGKNNVWADCGEILDAEYIRDLTAIINYILEQLNA